MNQIKVWAEKIINRSSRASLILLVAATAIAAQQIGNPTIQQGITGVRGIYVIRNAHIVTVSGPEIENGSVVIREGKIEAVGTNVTVPRGAQAIDARGLSAYPGTVEAGIAMGVAEV